MGGGALWPGAACTADVGHETSFRRMRKGAHPSIGGRRWEQVALVDRQIVVRHLVVLDRGICEWRRSRKAAGGHGFHHSQFACMMFSHVLCSQARPLQQELEKCCVPGIQCTIKLTLLAKFILLAYAIR